MSCPSNLPLQEAEDEFEDDEDEEVILFSSSAVHTSITSVYMILLGCVPLCNST